MLIFYRIGYLPESTGHCGNVHTNVTSDFRSAAETDYNHFDRNAAAMLIRRRHAGLYNNPVVLINYLYAVREETALYKKLNAGIRTRFPDGLNGLIEMKSYIESAWRHTQQQPQFKGFPGNDPWGQGNGEIMPEYKKLLPSEMIAMSMYTGQITGKCTTISAAVCSIISLFSSVPVNPDNIVLIRKTGHTFGLWKTGDNRILIFNNNHINQIGQPYLEHLQSEQYSHFFGLGFYARGNIRIPNDLLESKGSLREIFERSSGITADPVAKDPVLVNYALQKLSVPDPSLYIKVSTDLPHTKHLAHKLKNTNMVLEWMQQNLANGSIFPDCEDRVMTSDEVIVFKTGNPVDKAVLLCALKANHGKKAEIKAMNGQVTVHTDDTIIDLNELQVK